jgi:hypothetical protein
MRSSRRDFIAPFLPSSRVILWHDGSHDSATADNLTRHVDARPPLRLRAQDRIEAASYTPSSCRRGVIRRPGPLAFSAARTISRRPIVGFHQRVQ